MTSRTLSVTAPRVPALAAAGFAFVLLGGCGPERPAAPATDLVVWIVVDTLRADALGAYGRWEQFAEHGDGALAADATTPGEGRPDASGGPVAATPHLDRFASEDALVFEEAYAVSPWTAPSLVSQGTGLYPHEHGVIRLLQPVPAALVTVPEALRTAGWRTGGATGNFVATGLLGFDQGFEEFDDQHAKGHEGSSVDELVAATLGQLDRFGAQPGEGRFLWALWFEPHWRYILHPGLRFGPAPGESGAVTGGEELGELRRRAAAQRTAGAADALTERDLAVLRGLYQSEVARIDRAFGELRAELEARGLWERALVVFTADHGEQLGEGGWLGHTENLSQALMHVPLLVKLPGPPRPGRVAARVSQVDLAPGILEALGLDPAALGRPPGAPSIGALLEDPSGPAPRDEILLHVDFAPVIDAASTPKVLQWGVVDATTGLKWVVDHRDPSGAPRGSLYDLAVDSSEERNLAADEAFPAAARAIARRLGLVPEPLGARSGGERVTPK